jgi:RDD family
MEEEKTTQPVPESEKITQEEEKPDVQPEVESTGITLEKADPVKRVIALVIDSVIAMVVGFIPLIGGIIGALYMLLRDALPVEALNYKSLGKKVINLKVVMVDDPSAKPDYAASAKRNWMFALGPIMMFLAFIPILGWILDILLLIGLLVIGIIETVKVFTDPKGIRMGDNMAGTMVLEDPQQ